jgi:hypothetical protein
MITDKTTNLQKIIILTFSLDTSHAHLTLAEFVMRQLLDFLALFDRNHWQFHDLQHWWRNWIVDIKIAPTSLKNVIKNKKLPIKVKK